MYYKRNNFCISKFNRYKENIDKLSILFKDRPTPILDTALYWIEYVIRHKGAPHLRTVSVNLPWYQYFLLDIIGTLTIIFVFITFSLYKLLFVLIYLQALIRQKMKKN